MILLKEDAYENDTLYEIIFDARYLKKHLASGLGRSDRGSLSAVIINAT